MKVQLFASTALMLISAIPGALSAEHLHPKEAVTATAADFEDDFEEKSPSAKSFSLRGAVAVAASAEDAADEEEELKQWKGGWKQHKVKIPKVSIPKPHKVKAPTYSIPKKYTTPYYPGAGGAYDPCRTLFRKDSCRHTPACKWSGGKCGPKNSEDEEFDSQDLQKFDAPEEDEVYSESEEVDED